jgi:hypothetical protein
MLISDRDSARRFFIDTWEKYRQGRALEPLEDLVLGVILDHPEYQSLLEDPDQALARDFPPEAGRTNPFLHMGMHVAIREQVGADHPAGIAALYQTLLRRYGDAHGLEHRIMECLGEALWIAQRNHTLPDERAYLDCVQNLS